MHIEIISDDQKQIVPYAEPFLLQVATKLYNLYNYIEQLSTIISKAGYRKNKIDIDFNLAEQYHQELSLVKSDNVEKTINKDDRPNLINFKNVFALLNKIITIAKEFPEYHDSHHEDVGVTWNNLVFQLARKMIRKVC